MNWYRITFAVDGKRMKPVELEAHNLADAAASAAVKRGLYDDDFDDLVRVVGADCIDEPEHVAAERERMMTARMQANQFTDMLVADLARSKRSAL